MVATAVVLPLQDLADFKGCINKMILKNINTFLQQHPMDHQEIGKTKWNLS